MGDKVLIERDIHGIVKIFLNNSDLIVRKDVLCGALGLTFVEREDIAIRVDRDRSGTYNYLFLVLTKWIGLNGNKATVKRLAAILREERFNSTAQILESLPVTSHRSPEESSNINNDKPLQVSESTSNEFQTISEREKGKVHSTCTIHTMQQTQSHRKGYPKPVQITEKSTKIKTKVCKYDKIVPVPKSSPKELQTNSSVENNKSTLSTSTETNEIKNTIPSIEPSDKSSKMNKMSTTEMSDQFKQVKLEDSRQAQFSSLKKLTTIRARKLPKKMLAIKCVLVVIIAWRKLRC